MDKIEQENILAVEGKDEKNFFEDLLKNLAINNIQIIDVGGKDNFKNRFSAYIQTDGALTKIKRSDLYGMPKKKKQELLLKIFVLY